LQAQTKYTYREIRAAISTTRWMEIVAYSLWLSVSTIENYFNEWKIIVIISELVKIKKLWKVIAKIYENKDNVYNLAGLN
jgi:hypothetical protein